MGAYRLVPSPLGPLLLATTARGVCWCDFCDGGPEQALLSLRRHVPDETFTPDGGPALEEAAAQLAAYFAGHLQTFRLPCDLRGTAFRVRVWHALQAIPFGEVRTYGDLARALGAPSAARAVGGACGANPVSVIVPCHRVVGAGGEVGGYGGGLWRKHWLLAHEARAGAVTGAPRRADAMTGGRP